MTMTDDERYEQVCQPQFAALFKIYDEEKRESRARHQELKLAIEDFDKKMFKGNGGDPIDVQLVKMKNDVDNTTKAVGDICKKNDARWGKVFWFLGVLLVATVPHLINAIIAVINHIFGKG